MASGRQDRTPSCVAVARLNSTLARGQGCADRHGGGFPQSSSNPTGTDHAAACTTGQVLAAERAPTSRRVDRPWCPVSCAGPSHCPWVWAGGCPVFPFTCLPTVFATETYGWRCCALPPSVTFSLGRPAPDVIEASADIGLLTPLHPDLASVARFWAELSVIHAEVRSVSSVMTRTTDPQGGFRHRWRRRPS